MCLIVKECKQIHINMYKFTNKHRMRSGPCLCVFRHEVTDTEGFVYTLPYQKVFVNQNFFIETN